MQNLKRLVFFQVIFSASMAVYNFSIQIFSSEFMRDDFIYKNIIPSTLVLLVSFAFLYRSKNIKISNLIIISSIILILDIILIINFNFVYDVNSVI